jgi:hypothetical protein
MRDKGSLVLGCMPMSAKVDGWKSLKATHYLISLCVKLSILREFNCSTVKKENGAINDRKLLICPVKFQMTVPESEDRTEKTREKRRDLTKKEEPLHHVPWARDKQAQSNVHLVKLI